ncbi:MAG: FtsX-like permease family protein [Fimbriiglobus sp.]|jgi:putative ABC transport system permease protein|nr:FtsX-like permease family protein [Fimbriiglobus sp.]
MTAARLALSSLLHQPGRTAVSVVGTAFAVVLVFMQLGFLGAVETTATQLYDKLQFDVLVTSGEYIDLSRPGRLSRDTLARLTAVEGVADVHPLSIGQAYWKNPTDDPVKGKRRWALTVLGVPPGDLDRVFRPPGQGGIFATADEQAAKQAALGRIGEVLFDELSRADFGKPALMPPGTRTEMNGQAITLAGYFRAGTGFNYTGLLLTNERTFADTIGFPPDQVSFGLVTATPGQSPEELKQRVMAGLNGVSVKAFTRDEIGRKERDYWVNRTALGQFFLFGVVLAITVGGIFIYQMMVADIKKHLPEYATLKAMGYQFGYLFRVVVWQAVYLSIAGYVLGLAGGLLLYELARGAAQLPIGMTWERVGVVLALAVGMCVASGLLAVRKVKTADPADLF